MKRISPEEAYDKCHRQEEIPHLPAAPAGRRRELIYAPPRTRLHPDHDAGLPAGGVRPAVHRGQAAAGRVLRRAEARRLRPAHREADPLPDRDGRAQPDRREPVAHRGSAARAAPATPPTRSPTRRASASTSSPSAATTPSSCRKLNTVIPTLEWLQLPGDHQADSAGKDRPGAGHRRHRLRQIHHAGRRPQRDQPHQARPHRHAGRPGRVRPSRTTWPPSTSANWAPISTPSPTACAPPCARRPRSSSSAKCATARPSRSP